MTLTTLDQGVSVEESVIEYSPVGTPREIDIRISGGKDDVRVLVECRARKRKQDVIWIDELAGKANLLGFEHVVAVSESGFTQPALAEAAYRGIEAIQLHDAEDREWAQWLFGRANFQFTDSGYPLVDKVSVLFVDPQAGRQVPNIESLNSNAVQLYNAKTQETVRLQQFIYRHIRSGQVLQQAYDDVQKSEPQRKPGDHVWTGVIFPFQEGSTLTFLDSQVTLPVKAIRVFFRLVDITEQLRPQRLIFQNERIYVARSKVFPTRKYIMHEADGVFSISIEEIAPITNLQKAQRNAPSTLK